MKIADYRFRIPHLELTEQGGQTFCIPWTEVRGGERQICFERSIRRTIQGMPWLLSVSPRQALAARLLRQRAEWRDLDQPCKFPSISRVLAFCGGSIAIGISLLIVCLYRCPRWHAPTEWNTMPSEFQFVTIFVCILFTFAILALYTTPLILCWPYLRFRIRNPDWKALRLTRSGLVFRRRDGFEDRLLWADLVSFDGRGRLCFSNQTDDPAQMFIFENPAWRFIRDRLNRTHADKRVEYSIKQEIRRIFVALAVSAISAEIVLAYVLGLLKMNRPTPGKLFSFAMLIGGFITARAWIETCLQKRREARLRRKTHCE